jgi:galactokinase
MPPVATCTSLSSLFGADTLTQQQLDRVDVMRQCFVQHFEGNDDARNEFWVRAPGRVNLIGEHVDYCGYSVMPMAIQQAMLFMVRPNQRGSVRVANVDATFGMREYSVRGEVMSVPDDHHWTSYFVAAFKGVEQRFPGRTGQGFDVVASGTVPKVTDDDDDDDDDDWCSFIQPMFRHLHC